MTAELMADYWAASRVVQKVEQTDLLTVVLLEGHLAEKKVVKMVLPMVVH